MDYQQILDEIALEIKPMLKDGKVADYIPALGGVDPEQFAMTLTLFDGTQYSVGESEKLFSIQSIGGVSRILEMKLPQLVEKLSYSIYMMHALINLMAFNIFQYIFKFKTSSIGTYTTNALIFDWANMVNVVLIVLVIVSSLFIHKWIEIPWQERFRKYANE